MKIINIFAPNLLAIHYKNDDEDIYSKVLGQWQDVVYIKNFFDENKNYIIGNNYISVQNLQEFHDKVYQLASEFDENLEQAHIDNNLYENFEILSYNDDIHSLQTKSKSKNKFLRIYAIKVENTYIVTGGAIKMTELMQDHPHTKIQLQYLDQVKYFLQEKGIMDEDALYEYLLEQEK